MPEAPNLISIPISSPALQQKPWTLRLWQRVKAERGKRLPSAALPGCPWRLGHASGPPCSPDIGLSGSSFRAGAIAFGTDAAPSPFEHAVSDHSSGM